MEMCLRVILKMGWDMVTDYASFQAEQFIGAIGEKISHMGMERYTQEMVRYWIASSKMDL